MGDEKYVLGLFRESEEVISAVKALKRSPFKLDRVHSPFPHHGISDAMGMKKSRVGYFTLVGGVIGLLSGFGLAVYTAGQWHLVVGGKPVVALIPFFIVGFEFTILFSVIGNIVGLLTLARLPDYKGLRMHDPRCTGDHFGIVAACTEGEEQKLMAFLQEQGGECVPLDGLPAK